MLSPGPTSPFLSRGVPGAMAIVATMVLAGCSGNGDDVEAGPMRITPTPNPEAAAAMIAHAQSDDPRLDACALLDQSTAEIIQPTGASMPETDPTGTGDLRLVCTYGGPSSAERAAGEGDEDDDTTGDNADAEDEEGGDDGTDEEDSDDDDTTATSTDGATTTSVTTSATPTSTTATTDADADDATTSGATTSGTATPTTAFDPDLIPDTFAAGVVRPVGGAEAALASQPVLLGARLACSEVRGTMAATIEGAPAASPEAPGPASPPLATAFIDCVSAPTGGGVEVHTIFIDGDDLWHMVMLQPETPRTAEAETEALAGLHRVARQVLTTD